MILPGGKAKIPEDEWEKLQKVMAEFAKAAKDFGVRQSVRAPDEPKAPEPILFPSPEMERLRMLLDYNGLVWADKSDNKIPEMAIERTHLYFGGVLCSIIHGYGTYGGYNTFTGHDEGLLELMCEKVNDGEPLGELTADDVIVIIEGIRQGTL